MYLCLFAGQDRRYTINPANMYEMGRFLRSVAAPLVDAGATPSLSSTRESTGGTRR